MKSSQIDGRGGSILWPTRSSDITPLDFFYREH